MAKSYPGRFRELTDIEVTTGSPIERLTNSHYQNYYCVG